VVAGVDDTAMVVARWPVHRVAARWLGRRDAVVGADAQAMVVARWPVHRVAARWLGRQDAVVGAAAKAMVAARWRGLLGGPQGPAWVVTRKVNDRFQTRRPYSSVWILTKTES